SYSKAPTGFRVDSARLYAAYLEEQTEFRERKSQARAEARALRNHRIEQAKRKAKLQRAAVKLMGKGLSVRIAYMTIRANLRAEIDRAVQAYHRERQALQQCYPLRSWMDWLKVRSRDRQAQAVLQSQARFRARTPQPQRSQARDVSQGWSR
ncbi:MAG: Conjugal transfer protein TraI, partial [Proteobacteria bacterium]|nr:Conjugal transfer protein TraI [Pseudomonadota bacterium]